MFRTYFARPISLALSAGEDPGWVAQVCGTSERMIFQHYRKFMSNLRRQDGRRLAGLYRDPSAHGHRVGTQAHPAVVSARNLSEKGAGGIEYVVYAPVAAALSAPSGKHLPPTLPPPGRC